ncbi:MAG: hypothetical protein ACLUKN_11475 [Bacilli bacterium]
MSAANNDELVEISMTNDPNGGKDWYSIVGVKILFGRENAFGYLRTLDLNLREGSPTTCINSWPQAPLGCKGKPRRFAWSNIITTILPIFVTWGYLLYAHAPNEGFQDGNELRQPSTANVAWIKIRSLLPTSRDARSRK